MPAAIPYIASWLVPILGGAAAGYAAITIAYAVQALVVNYALGAISKLLSGNDHQPSVDTGQQFTIRNTVGSRVICYGQLRTSGLEVFEYCNGGRP